MNFGAQLPPPPMPPQNPVMALPPTLSEAILWTTPPTQNVITDTDDSDDNTGILTAQVKHFVNSYGRNPRESHYY